MQFVRILFFLAETCVRVLFRRLRKGPLRPTWGFVYEAGIEFLRALTVRAGLIRDISRQRALAESVWIPPLTSLMTFSRWDTAGDLRIRRIYPLGWRPNRAILYLRGGAYTFSIPMHERLMIPFSLAARAPVVVPYYRLAPEYPFPAAVEDALSAYRWMLDLGCDAQNIILAGDSAGGGLVLALLSRIRALDLPYPRLAVLISPWVDLACSGASMDENARYDWINREISLRMGSLYAPERLWSHPEISPLFANLGGFPPLYIQAGEAEVLRDQILALAECAREQGVTVLMDLFPDMVHEFQAFDRFTPQSRAALNRLRLVINDFFRA